MTAVILIDVGNSRVKWCFDDPGRALPSGPGEAIPLAEIESLAERWAAGPQSVVTAYISNVASPRVDGAIERLLTAAWPSIRITRVASRDAGFGVINGYDAPSSLGTDRWLAMVGAHALLPTSSLLVCTFGTATTIDLLVSEDGGARFVGGLILPGVDTMKAALVGGTARLFDRPGALVDFATDTADAIASGIASAQIGAVARALARSRERTGAPATLVVSGGAAAALLPCFAALDAPWQAVPQLVLVGLGVVVRADYDGATADAAQKVARRD
jgi:type III pantothenate kinase